MDFFPTLPPKVAVLLDEGVHHFVQAHHLLRHSLDREVSDEQGWYRYHGAGPLSVVASHWVTLDNGCWELGEPDIEALKKVAEVIHPHEVVLPDAYCNKELTLQWMREYAYTCRALAPCVMAVPQGNNLLEWTQCAQNMLAYLGSTSSISLGIPKVVETFPGGRQAACEYLEYYNLIPTGGIHLLGVWTSLEEICYPLSIYKFIRSVDTTLPYAWAMAGKCMADPSSSRKKVKMEDEWWHQTPSPAQKMLAAINISYCRRVVGGK